MKDKNPEHISSILKRILADIQRNYEERKAVIKTEQGVHNHGRKY